MVVNARRRRIAVIGAGPSGLYAAAALAASTTDATVDVIDRLPAPYGLVRYGVAPDHIRMKSVIRVLQRPFEASPSGSVSVRFLGNVAVGRDVSLTDLRPYYHAIVHATGSSQDRRLGLRWESLRGSIGSSRFVGWYSGHPDHADLDPPLDSPAVAVVGAGNVALDVARVLARSPQEMAATDVPDQVLTALTASAVRDVHVLVRRAPQHVRFTPAELAQLGDLAGAEVMVHDDGLLSAAIVEESLDRRQLQNLELLRDWAGRPGGTGSSRRIHLHFMRSPVEILGSDRVTGVVLERNRLGADGRITGTGERETLDVGLVVRAIGYLSQAVEGLPFDERNGTVPHVAGRVVDQRGQPVLGHYVTGWIKRGPGGVIGTNKPDAAETVASLLVDLPQLPAPAHPEPEQVLELLERRGVRPVDWSGWLRLDAEEVRLGPPRGAERVKVAELPGMLAVCAGV